MTETEELQNAIEVLRTENKRLHWYHSQAIKTINKHAARILELREALKFYAELKADEFILDKGDTARQVLR